MQFDESTVLRVEMAHKNMFLKDDPSIKRAGPGGLGRLSMGGALAMQVGGGGLPGRLLGAAGRWMLLGSMAWWWCVCGNVLCCLLPCTAVVQAL